MTIEQRLAEIIQAFCADALSDLNMLILTGGQERTNAEYGQLLAEAGLSLAKVQPITPPYGVIEAVPS